MPSPRFLLLPCLALLLTGCGPGEAAATADLQARQAAQAQQQMAQLKEQIDQANARNQERLDEGEKAAQ
ncbi:MAG: hypothetical protein GAK45_00431 [Pseudomonas citronellolis]|nr:MAG: hypothetical protein GAK45_00431 [Pseudomonas citronellolis]